MNFPQYDTIAIVGRAGDTRHHIKNIKDDTALFTIAACFDLPEIKRMDACVEIHPMDWLSHHAYNQDLRKWLNQHHAFPLYMMEEYEGIPAAVKFPLDLITDRFLGQLRRGDKVNRFFTSSFDYSMGLALLHNPRRIEVIGYSMATDTEYYYQREGASFWLGLAAGAGIEVWIPPECPMIKADMYAYEGTQLVRNSRLKELYEQARDWMEEAAARHIAAREALPASGPIDKDLMKTYGLARDDFFLKSGACQAVEQMLERFALETFVARQEVERHKMAMAAEKITMQAKMNFWEGIVRDRYQRWEQNRNAEPNQTIFKKELDEANVEQNQYRDQFFMREGAVDVLTHLIKECDLQADADWEPKTNVIEVEVTSEKDKRA